MKENVVWGIKEDEGDKCHQSVLFMYMPLLNSKLFKTIKNDYKRQKEPFQNELIKIFQINEKHMVTKIILIYMLVYWTTALIFWWYMDQVKSC